MDYVPGMCGFYMQEKKKEKKEDLITIRQEDMIPIFGSEGNENQIPHGIMDRK